MKIFNFDYPVHSEEYKKRFEEQFIQNFYFEEIGYETVGMFIFKLKAKLNLVMPNFMKILETQLMEQRILDNYDVTETFDKSSSNLINSSLDSENTNKINATGENKNLYSDTPKTKIDIDSVDFVKNISKDISKNDNTSVGSTTSTNITTGDDNEKWVRTMTGNIGIQTDADAIMKFWQSLRNVEQEIFEECSSLFMEVY
ncbi:MAG: hypothetical protein ACRC5M_01560 [Anaeroplasmataceae bacterium]